MNVENGHHVTFPVEIKHKDKETIFSSLLFSTRAMNEGFLLRIWKWKNRSLEIQVSFTLQQKMTANFVQKSCSNEFLLPGFGWIVSISQIRPITAKTDISTSNREKSFMFHFFNSSWRLERERERKTRIAFHFYRQKRDVPDFSCEGKKRKCQE